MKTITRISRITVGLVFVFSGFVKGVDPIGFAIKLSEYFTAFGMKFFDPLSLPLAIILCTVEFLAGIMLLSGSFNRLSAWLVSLFMAFFTPLTLILAINNPVSDCGCFGDAVHLTNWQTFIKNIIIVVFVILVFIKRNDNSASVRKKDGLFLTAVNLVVFLVFIILNITQLPVIDFRPYKAGTDLLTSMSIPADAASDKYDIRFIYEKDGIQKEFTLADYPANDTSWKFIDQKSLLISRGYIPPIHDFVLVTNEGVDLTDEIVKSEGYTFLLVSKKIEESNQQKLKDGIEAGETALSNGIRFHILTSSSGDYAGNNISQQSLLYCDETTLKTIIRSNPGFLLIRNGVVAAKWSSATLPDFDKFKDPGRMAQSFLNHNRIREIITFTIFSVLVLISIFAPKYLKH